MGWYFVNRKVDRHPVRGWSGLGRLTCRGWMGCGNCLRTKLSRRSSDILMRATRLLCIVRIVSYQEIRITHLRCNRHGFL